MQETSTRSPGRTVRTSLPTSTISPTASWPEDRARTHLGHVALEDVQVRAADGDGVDPDDRVGGVLDAGVRDLLPGGLPGAVEDEAFHGASHHPFVRLPRLLHTPRLSGMERIRLGRPAPLVCRTAHRLRAEEKGPEAHAAPCDLRPVSFIDCAGLGVLCRALNRARARHSRLRLGADNAPLLRILRGTGLSCAFDIHPRWPEDPAGTSAEAESVSASADRAGTTGPGARTARSRS